MSGLLSLLVPSRECGNEPDGDSLKVTTCWMVYKAHSISHSLLSISKSHSPVAKRFPPKGAGWEKTGLPLGTGSSQRKLPKTRISGHFQVWSFGTYFPLGSVVFEGILLKIVVVLVDSLKPKKNKKQNKKKNMPENGEDTATYDGYIYIYTSVV